MAHPSRTHRERNKRGTDHIRRREGPTGPPAARRGHPQVHIGTGTIKNRDTFTPIEEVEGAIKFTLDDEDVDTLAGVPVSRGQKLPEVGDKVEREHATAELLEARSDYAEVIRITIEEPSQ